MAIARDTLLRFFTYLHDGRYAEAADLYGGDYEELAEVAGIPPSQADDKALVLDYACAMLQCMLVSAVVEEQVSPKEFDYFIEFMTDEDIVSARGLLRCVGSPNAEHMAVAVYGEKGGWGVQGAGDAAICSIGRNWDDRLPI